MAELTLFLIKRRSELLTALFIALVLASPIADTHPRIGGIIAFFVLVTLLAGASYMANQKIVRRLVLPLAGIWIVARLLEAICDPRFWYAHMAPVAGLFLSCSIIWAILNRFDTTPVVTLAVISEAFVSYMVIAIAFSQVYWILNQLCPDPFNRVIPAGETSTLLYFSMITLTTVGYGGILPINPYVRLVAGLEAMAGVFYIAVVVARLVSSYRPPPRGL